MAGATIFDDRICEFQRGHVDVELNSERLLGMTHWTADETHGEHQVALKVNRDRFIKHYFKVVGHPGARGNERMKID